MRTSTEGEVRLKVRDLMSPYIHQDLRQAVEDAIIHFLWEGFVEGESIAEYVEEFLCPWDRKMHRDPECLRELEKFNEEERKGNAINAL